MSGTPPAAKAEQMAAGQPRIPLTLPESFMIGGLAGCAAVTVSEYTGAVEDLRPGFLPSCAARVSGFRRQHPSQRLRETSHSHGEHELPQDFPMIEPFAGFEPI